MILYRALMISHKREEKLEVSSRYEIVLYFRVTPCRSVDSFFFLKRFITQRVYTVCLFVFLALQPIVVVFSTGR
jgi:hypothetical protein